MSIIGRGVQVVHILGIIIVSSIFLYNLSVKSEPQGETENDKTGKPQSSALTVVESSDDDDGIITVEENGSDDESQDTQEKFEATKEWKAVKKGQKIPAGLHVRLDMQTGQRQAKLMEQDSTPKMERWDAGKNIGIINTEKKRFTRDELKAVLKDFKYKDATTPSEPQDTKARDEEVKSKFRSYEELKKDMKDINMAVKTEGQIVVELGTKLRQPNIDHDHLKTILMDLEYYLHQIDNAQIFCDNGGMQTVMQLLNNSEADIRKSTILTLGAAVQSNPKVQVAALDTGMMQQLLRLLSVDPSLPVRQKALFALSGLVRQFPYAQKKFLQLGGLSSLADLFSSSKSEKIKIKIITLLSDLVQEFDFNVNQIAPQDSVQEKRAEQYQQVDLRESMSSSGWCGLMISLLQSPTEHDSVEKIILAMSALVDTCKTEFTPARPKLQALMQQYKTLALDEETDGTDKFFTSIYTTVQQLIQKIYREDL